MACFIVPAAEAIVATVVAHILESKEKKAETMFVAEDVTHIRTVFSSKVRWLSKLLWGGSFLLAFEHVWHGEIKPFFPFLTAAESPESFTAMLNITHIQKSYPSEVSGREYHRVILARTLLLHTDILLADEPTSNLDASSAEIVRDVLNEYANENHILIVSKHDSLLAAQARKIFVWVIESVYGLQ